jgi:serine/threonine protein kinase
MTLIAMFTGRTPYDEFGDNREQLYTNVSGRHDPPNAFWFVNVKPIQNLIRSCIKKDPEARPSAADVRIALTKMLRDYTYARLA